MNTLKYLGLAPSEISFNDLLIRIEKERTRVREAINLWRSGVFLKPIKEKKVPSKAKKKANIADEYMKTQELLKSLGVI